MPKRAKTKTTLHICGHTLSFKASERRGSRWLRPSPIRAARQGFVAAGVHPGDVVSGMIVLRLFWNTELVREPVRQWEIGEKYLDELGALAQEIAAARRSMPKGAIDARLIHGWRERIEELDLKALPGIVAFKVALGDSGRQTKLLLLWSNALLVLGLSVFAFWRADWLLQTQKAIEEELAIEREGAQMTLGAIGEGVIALDRDGRPMYLNQAARRLLGVRLRDIQHKLPCEWMRLDPSIYDEAYVERLCANATRGELPQELLQPVRLLHPDGTVKTIQFALSPLKRKGEWVGAALVLRDVTNEQRLLEELAWQASHDELTGLLNRREFERRLEKFLVQRNGADAGALQAVVLYIDLDQFKVINDTVRASCG